MGQIDDLTITAERSALAGASLLWLAFTAIGVKAFRLRPGAAVAGGLLATLLHFAAELWHQLGHARAARQTGHPMTGVHVWGVLGTSVYPADEGELPHELHVARAVGGPEASARLTAVGALLALVTRPLGGFVHMAATLFALDNWLIFTLGAFLPLPFLETDGAVLLRRLRRDQPRNIVIQE